jgi:hypothetical protein
VAMVERKPFLLRINSGLYAALARWADDEKRSLNGQIEFLLNRILVEAGRSPTSVSSRVLAPRPAARKPSGTRAQVRQSTSASSRARAPRPAVRKPTDESPPSRRPNDDWDAMVD